jgi:O-succinylbenzoic acid--CoA ligase
VSVLDLARTPSSWRQRVAIVESDGTEHTYEQLSKRVARRSTELLRAGGEVRGRLVLTPGSASLESVVRLLAVWSVGGIVMPAHPRWSDSERHALVSQANPALDWNTLGGASEQRHAAAVGTRLSPDAAVVMFTSGTSGQRKGVVLTHENLLAAAQASEQNLGWYEDDRWALGIPVAHVGGLSIVIRSLLAGACVVCTSAFDSATYHAERERLGVTLDSLVPTMLARLVREQPVPPAGLRAVLIGGAAATPSVISRARADGWPLRLTYGMTETAAQFCTQRGGDFRPDGGGPPLPGCEVDVRSGTLWVRGKSVAKQTLPGSPPLQRDESGWLCTGDVAEIRDDGSVYIRARFTELIISGGENVYPQEVERALSRHPCVNAVCVVGEPNPEWGHSVVAAVEWSERAREEIKASGETEASALRAHARSQLAPHARPRRYLSVNALPTTAGGKLDRDAVLALVLSTDGADVANQAVAVRQDDAKSSAHKQGLDPQSKPS